jgi:hypothetical protein
MIMIEVYFEKQLLCIQSKEWNSLLSVRWAQQMIFIQIEFGYFLKTVYILYDLSTLSIYRSSI